MGDSYLVPVDGRAIRDLMESKRLTQLDLGRLDLLASALLGNFLDILARLAQLGIALLDQLGGCLALLLHGAEPGFEFAGAFVGGIDALLQLGGLALGVLDALGEALDLGAPPGGEFLQLGHAAGHRRALMLAQDEAWRLDDPCIGTEHLLLGLLREPEGRGGTVLREAGLHLDDLRRRIVKIKQRPLPDDDEGSLPIRA